ncbi:outer membrane beta-barrel protein [Chitinophaga sedimenti]|uniref:outer membrane beta-barrel protein n=1 Tax=Chitinophaga sedimenti TaxID=2033606 RepID=UPI002002C1B4|nr:outer membrane beta-barrel protein [Chitinophaga sedimenti]MCK7553908.1 outer membrane beta-barrel protein [Chitinophaga sedimenti]
MKKLILALAIITCTGNAFAQEQMETLAKPKSGNKIRVGGYGAPTVHFTPFADKFAVMTGGNAGVMLNSKIMLGAGAYALVNDIEAPRTNIDDPTRYWNMWYTGFVAEYTFNSNKLLHWGAGALIGGGMVGKNTRWKPDTENHTWVDESSFFAAEPYANLEINIAKFLRVGVGASYRFIRGSNTPGISDGDMSGPAAHVTIKAGRF